jgi:hypothetical protein
MAKDADYGLMIWDGKSKGTLANINEMKKQRKSFYIIKGDEIINDKKTNSKILQKAKRTELQLALL